MYPTVMTAQAAATLINLLAFITGIALYTMLLVMLLGGNPVTSESTTTSNKLPLATALLGVVWTLGAFVVFGLEVLGQTASLVWVQATAFTALGFLPAVVVHSVLRGGETVRGRSWWLIAAAYGVSSVASALQFVNAFAGQPVPAHVALHLLTFGFGGLIVLMLLTLRERWWRSAGWVIALAVFAVSAAHLSHHEGDDYTWWVELIGHHSSLPLALVILYQDYRFALADIFLKRALSLLGLVALASSLYFLVAAPLMTQRASSDPRVVGLLLTLWILTALLYPMLRRRVYWLVDAVLLQRVDYDHLRDQITKAAAKLEEPEELLDDVCRRIAHALTARRVSWQEGDAPNVYAASPRMNLLRRKKAALQMASATPPPAQEISAVIPVPTTDVPAYQLLVGELTGGRRLLSDDLAMLESVALMIARRIDAMRVTRERYEHKLREQEMNTLATEAELRALRAQINPHFLFNALTTIGYLIQEAPDRAVQTLLRLTGLLRGVLRRSEGEFSTLGEEIELIADYLEIEQARFESRLRVHIDVPVSLCALRIPALLLQPLVENAIKHGIAPLRVGGEVTVQARIDATAKTLYLAVKDTGAGTDPQQLRLGYGIGLANVERRLRVHYDDRAIMKTQTAKGQGMTVELEIPLEQIERSEVATKAVADHPSRRQA
ncbi:MAG: histidine kinase [Blastocatellia bacterium]|nr:histidine kinase [Blastocatellia bacterium]